MARGQAFSIGIRHARPGHFIRTGRRTRNGMGVPRHRRLPGLHRLLYDQRVDLMPEISFPHRPASLPGTLKMNTHRFRSGIWVVTGQCCYYRLVFLSRLPAFGSMPTL